MFGTDGIRGITGQDLTADLATKLGNVAGSLLCKGSDKVVIGRDTRGSGEMLENALTEGFVRQGIEVIKLGVIPTPAIAYITGKLGAVLGIVISASHNPSEYNGIKFFNSNGVKLSEDKERLIEDNLASFEKLGRRTNGKTTQAGGNDLYIEHLKEAVSIPLDGLKVMFDCANGAASLVGPRLFSELGVEVSAHACSPTADNINHECGSTYPQALQKNIKNSGFDVGIAFDGDADRAIAVDENGFLVDGDFIIAICAKNYHDKSLLKADNVVTTVMTNLGFHHAMQKMGIDVLVTDVGDKYVLGRMIEENANLGGEQSGHIIFLDHGPAGDGLITALKLLQVIQESGKPLSELSKIMERLPQVLINVGVKDKKLFRDNKRLEEAIKEAEVELGSEGRILVRPSGTEHLIRVMTESQTLDHAKQIANSVADVVREESLCVE